MAKLKKEFEGFRHSIKEKIIIEFSASFI